MGNELGLDFYIAVGSLALAFGFYTWLTIHNYRNLIATKQERLEARRLERKNRKSLFRFPM